MRTVTAAECTACRTTRSCDADTELVESVSVTSRRVFSRNFQDSRLEGEV